MKRSGKRWVSALALVTGVLGAGFVLKRRKRMTGGEAVRKNRNSRSGGDRWARPGMGVTFRAELMPGRSRAERTFRVVKLLPSGRVTLEGVAGEHTETEFEPLRLE